MSVLVLDWGIGGLATLSALRARAPHLPLLYLSDAGFTPYGRVPHEALGARLEALCSALEALHGPLSGLMVACNAASSALTPTLKLPPTLSVIDSGVEATLEALAQRSHLQHVKPHEPLRVGVVGGEATISSRLYERALTSRWSPPHAHPLDVVSVVAQPISAHVEAGRMSGPELEADLQRICEPLRDVHALTLACTHYPAVRNHFSAQLPHALLIDPLDHFVARSLERWGAPPLVPPPSPAPLTLYTTGDPNALIKGARLAWGVNMSDLNISEAQLKHLDPHLLTPLPTHLSTHTFT